MSECVLSNRTPNAGGNKAYVSLRVGDRKMSLGRAVYQVWNGTVPAGLEIDHLCNQPLCINHLHLEAVTHKENDRRRAMRRTHCPHGHEFLGRVLGGEAYPDGRQRRCTACLRRYKGR